MASASATVLELDAFVGARRARVVPGDEEDTDLGQPDYWLRIDGEVLQAIVGWKGCGRTEYSLQCSVRGEAAVPVNPLYLHSLLRLFPPDATVEICIPQWRGTVVQLRCGADIAALIPIKNEGQLLRERVEAVIREVAGPLAVVQDGDGDYPLRRYHTPIYGRLLENGEPAPLLQVFAMVLDDVEPSIEMLAELNDLNATLGFARIFLIDRQVLAEVDLVATTLDATELDTALDRISDLAMRITPMIAAVFGGTAPARAPVPRGDRRRGDHPRFGHAAQRTRRCRGVAVPRSGARDHRLEPARRVARRAVARGRQPSNRIRHPPPRRPLRARRRPLDRLRAK